MCDLFLTLYMFLYVYVAVCVISILAVWLPNLGYHQDARGASNRRCVSNRVHLLLVPQ
jgi:hypothetical protein